VPPTEWPRCTQSHSTKNFQVARNESGFDLLLCKAGKLVCLELKSERGRLSKAQKQCHDELRQAGAIVKVANNIDDAVLWLQKLGFLRGTMQ
jgi:hypothetical protein